jgi:asparagine synthase (glutamine-hydrolysing)
MDDLVVDYAALPLLKLSEYAARDVKVILSGEGGDEIFAGYGRYRQKWWHRILGRSFRGRGDLNGFENMFKFSIPASQNMVAPQNLTAIQQQQWLDIQDWLPDDLLLKVDRCLMRYSIEGRVPYLDDKFAEFAFSLPDTWKIKGKHGKWVLKAYLQSKHIFMDVFAKKKGFTVPIHDWLSEKQQDIYTFLKDHKGIEEIIPADKLKEFFVKPFNKKQAKLCFSLLCYAYWYSEHIEK